VLTLATASLMLYRLQASSDGYKNLDKSPSLSTCQRFVLALFAIATIAATVTVAVYFGLQLQAAAPAGADTTVRALITGGTISKSTISLHNSKRRSIKKSMRAMQWDAKSASVAAAYIKKCPGLNHNPHRGNRGENIFVSSLGGMDANAAIKQAINAWFAEKKYYNYKRNSCSSGQMCGHYTQIVWNKSTHVGCAVNNNCPGTWKTQVVCDYAPPGNYVGQRPY